MYRQLQLLNGQCVSHLIILIVQIKGLPLLTERTYKLGKRNLKPLHRCHVLHVYPL